MAYSLKIYLEGVVDSLDVAFKVRAGFHVCFEGL